MDVNATILAQFIAFLIPISAIISYFIVKQKIQNPVKYSIVGALVALIPPLMVIYWLMLFVKGQETRLNEDNTIS